MPAPKLTESIPTANRPVVLPKLSRQRFLAGIITGGVLLVLDVAGLIWALVLS